jgi:hypothetical protein
VGPDRRLDNGRGRDSEGDGPRYDRRVAGAGGALHGAGADGDLRSSRDVSAAQHEHHHDTGHPGGGRNKLRKDLSWTPHLFQLLPRWVELLSAA